MASAILCLYWVVFSVVTVLLGAISHYKHGLPQSFKDLLLFGKAKGVKRHWTVVQLIEVPKSWFIHYYIIGSLVNGYILYTVNNVYVLQHPAPQWLVIEVEFLASYPQDSTIGESTAVLLIGLMFVQNMRRLFECALLSVYSRGTMNLVHYMMGISLYTLFHLSVLVESPDLQKINGCLLSDFLQWNHAFGFILFVWASYEQHKVNKTFAALRKNKQGEVVTLQHKIPRGGWFNYVSCPHYTMELLIYLSFVVISGYSHVTIWTVFVFVLTNQIISADMSHQWYRKTFKDYPKSRKAVIPYLF